MPDSDRTSAFEYCSRNEYPPTSRSFETLAQRRSAIAEIKAQLDAVQALAERFPVLMILFVRKATDALRAAGLDADPALSLADAEWLAEFRRALADVDDRARRACGTEAEEVQRICALASWWTPIATENARRVNLSQPTAHAPVRVARDDLLKLAALLLIAGAVGIFVHRALFVLFSVAAGALFAYVLALPRPPAARVPISAPFDELPAPLRVLSDVDLRQLETDIDAAVEDARMRWFAPDAPPELSIDMLLE